MALSTTPTALSQTLDAYLYWQYSDDDDLQAFFDAFNLYAQSYLDTFNGLNLPIYTGLSGPLLDWVAQGLYGISRPGLQSGGSPARGPYNTLPYNTGVSYNGYVAGLPSTYTATSDDTFKRIITWAFYKGDGFVFTINWLKRRIYRFLNGINGVDLPIANTYGISVAFTGAYAATITLATTPSSALFKQAANSGALELPFQTVFTVTLT